MTTRKTGFARSRRDCTFITDRQGSSVVEFALLLPLMLVMYFGSIEVTDAISADRQVTLVADTVADLASQYQTVSDSDVSNILDAASAVLAPFSIASAKVTLSSVQIDTNGNATVDWSKTRNGTTRNGVVTSSIPAALRVANTSLLWGEASYAYKPVIGWVVTGTFNLSNQIFMRPRQSQCVRYSGVSTLC